MTYLSEVMADNPLHFWRLADPGGKWANDLGSSLLGLVARANFDVLGYSGPNDDDGSSIHTNGAILWEVDKRTLGVPVTLECVFFQHNIDARLQVAFTTEYNGAGTGPGIGIDATGKPYMSNSSTLITAAAAPTFNHWHHMVGVHTGAARTLYIDAVQVATGANTLAAGYTGSFSVGGRPPAADQFAEMFMSEVAYYTTALSAARITAHYTALNNLPSRPVFKPYGTANLGTGTSTLNQVTLDLILASVRKSYVEP